MTNTSITTSRTVLTGANGFLGWHTRAALQEKAEEYLSRAIHHVLEEVRVVTPEGPRR